jgi:hypothetical protein
VIALASAFETGVTSGQTAATGFATTALPAVAAVAVAWLGVKYIRRVIARM